MNSCSAEINAAAAPRQLQCRAPSTLERTLFTSPVDWAFKMTVLESVKEAVGLGDGSAAPATRAQMSEAKLPLAYRDGCANLLIPLNKCRHETYFMPWKCVDERHSYEKCQYEAFKIRVAKMDEMRAAQTDEKRILEQ